MEFNLDHQKDRGGEMPLGLDIYAEIHSRHKPIIIVENEKWPNCYPKCYPEA